MTAPLYICIPRSVFLTCCSLFFFPFFLFFSEHRKQNKNASHLLLHNTRQPRTPCPFSFHRVVHLYVKSVRVSENLRFIRSSLRLFFSTSKLNEAGISLPRHTFFEYRSHTFSMTHHHISCFVREKKEWCCSFISLSFPMDDTPQVFLLSLTQ